MCAVKAVENIEHILIESGIDAGGAPAAREALLPALAGAESTLPIALEFDVVGPTAPALQLMIASWRSLDARGAFGGFGPIAADLMPSVRLSVGCLNVSGSGV